MIPGLHIVCFAPASLSFLLVPSSSLEPERPASSLPSDWLLVIFITQSIREKFHYMCVLGLCPSISIYNNCESYAYC